MKSCPSCHQVYPDNGPDYCTNDGTPLAVSTTAYNPGSAYNPGAGQGAQWQPPPPTGYGYPPAGGGYPPYGYVPAGGGGISKAALFTGIGSSALLFLAIIILVSGGRSRDTQAVVGILGLLMILASLAAIVLGIIALALASKNPNVSKAGAVIGLCLGVLPFLLWFIAIAGAFR